MHVEAAKELVVKLAVKRDADGAGDAFETRIPVLPDRDPVEIQAFRRFQGSAPLMLPTLKEAARPGTVKQSVLITDQEPLLIAALQKLESRGLAVVVHADELKAPPPTARLSLLEIVGQDRPGIVRQISHALAGFGVNVEELHTECASAAMSGETLFKARATLSIPESCDIAQIRQQLERIAEDLIVEISLAELPARQP